MAKPTRGTHIKSLPLIRRTLPSVIAASIAGVSPMTGPTGSVFAMRKKYRNTMAVGSTSKGHIPVDSARDRLRGRGVMRYHNPLLTQDRVRQVFGYYIGEHDYEDDCEAVGDYEAELDDRHYKSDYAVQLEFNLETSDTLEGEHRKMITRYNNAIEYMGSAALMWEDLMSDLEEFPHLKEEFDKFQMLRKLSGGTM